ncbi:hypothetical protein SCUCBS95973_007206 [Sporothrix curviconia]|uniref:Uncharacterized protein n=1 Tax=Sporothrix curviconia TaxID=1260050 RepID=A0ABP0CBJ4_9PEZI
MICDIFGRRRGYNNTSRGTVVQKVLYFSDDETDCRPASVPKPSRARRHPDRSRRRRSANADILESVGLPPTVSYHDMKTLQDGLSIDDILGRRSTCSARLKEAAAVIGGNAAQVAQRASRSAKSVARWSSRMTPPIVDKRLRKKAPVSTSGPFCINESLAPCPPYPEQGPEEDIRSHAMVGG